VSVKKARQSKDLAECERMVQLPVPVNPVLLTRSETTREF
jgi:hypothetical protein